MHKTYRSTNIARKVTLFLSIALIVIVSIGFLNLAESEVSRRSLQVSRYSLIYPFEHKHFLMQDEM